MVTRGKSINLYLMDGVANGRIKCTLANWTGVAYKIPRTEIESCKGRDDLNQSGVYFLFGISEKTGDSVVYVGQAGSRKNGEGVLHRLQEHKRNLDKDYWTEAVIFTTSNNSFGPTEISYLENRFCGMAVDAKRYVVKNSNTPSYGNVMEEKESELEDFISYAVIVMGTLGYKLFDPIIKVTVVMPIGIRSDRCDYDEEPFLYLRNAKADAVGRRVSDGFVVLKGSRVSGEAVPSCSDNTKKSRELYKDSIGMDLLLTEDILFKSPSAASSFVTYSQSNGRDVWLTDEGVSLKDFEGDI